jgi:hypothetical protein
MGIKQHKPLDIACPPSKTILDATDRIERGDRVSWQFDGEPRRFGRVVRLTTREFHRAFAVLADDDNTTTVIVPAKAITAERD